MNTAQISAADPKASVWVAASAGTGKTKVLTDRVLTLLVQGFAPERILCLTFTKAAAAEMANRLTQRLAKWAAFSPEELYADLQGLLGYVPSSSQQMRACQLFTLVLDTPGGMKIQTLHGFCQSILGRFPLEAQVSPHFHVLDEIQAKEIWAQAQQSVFLKSSPHVNNALNLLNPLMGDMRFTALMESFYACRSRIQETLNNHESVPDFALALLKFLKVDSVKIEECLSGSLIENRKQQFAPDIEDFEAYASVFITKEGEVRKNTAAAQLPRAEQIKQFVQFLKGLETAQRTLAFVILFQEILQVYEGMKLRRSALDYEDLIHKTQTLLNMPDIAAWILYKLDGGIDHLLIDEAQDTNTTQWQIIQSLTADFFTKPYRTFFAVGDAKQSIYSFQGADPRAFEHMKAFFATLVRGNGQNWREVQLNLSYRSVPAVLQAVDSVFSFARNCRGVSFDNKPIVHQAFRVQEPGIVELWPLIASPEDNPSVCKGEWPLPLARIEHTSPQKRLARYVACQIKQWLESGEILPSTNQPAQPRDVLILIRKRSDLGKEIIRALEKRSIPVAGADRLMLTDHIAVMDLLAVAQFVLLPEDNLTLACILRSPLIGMSEEELYTLAQGRGKVTLWASLCLKIHHSIGFRQAHGWLEELMYKADVGSAYDFFSAVLNEGQGKTRFLSRLGNEVEDVLEEFLNQCLRYDQIHAGSLQGFIQLMTMQPQEIKRDGSDTIHNQVRIMTVHGAKGLQAPIVILPDAAETGGGKKDVILWGNDLFVVRPSMEDDTPETQFLKAKSQSETDEEYRRLLYVALTRAQDRLYVGGYSRGRASSQESWYQILQQALGKQNISTTCLVSGEDEAWTNMDGSIPASLFAQPLLPEWVNHLPEGKEKKTGIYREKKTVPDRSSSKAMERGSLIHHLLDYLPSLPRKERYRAACQIIEREKEPLEIWREDIARILKILDDNVNLFGPDSLAEVSIVGFVDSNPFEGRIDRLLVTSDTVTIIDYKTDRICPKSISDVPEAYLTQLTNYEKVLQPLYPTHNIRKLIVWTEGKEGPFIQEI